MPQDSSSLLPMHSDVWSGNSPYEVVFWLPLVNCSKTQSMFLIPRYISREIQKDFDKFKNLSSNEIFNELKKEMVFLDVKYGQGLIFSHSIIHGNIINEEKTTRWTFNTRFKSLLTPYRDKELGESFFPLIIKPATRIGYEFEQETNQ